MPNQPVHLRRAWLTWAITLGAALLSLLALLATLQGLRGSQAAGNSPLVSVLNLLTAVCGLAGTLGFALRRRWGALLFGFSTIGHWLAHIVLLVALFSAGRGTLFGAVGLLAVPAAAALVWSAMYRQVRPAS